MLDIIRHWIPDLKQTKNKSVYVAKQCPFCPKVNSSKSFRLNVKLKVWKCYQCGRSGKTFNKFCSYFKKMGRHSIPIEVYYECSDDSPF